MPIPGSQVSLQIQNAYKAGQQALHAVRAEVKSETQVLESLAQEREKALAGLAKHYLPTLSEEAVMQLWQDVRPGLLGILHQWQDHIQQLNDEILGYEREHEEVETQVTLSANELDRALGAQQKVAEQVALKLGQDEHFKTLTRRAAEAEAALERAETSLEELEHETLEKVPAYENSKLFMYLYRRGLATPAYTAKGLTRRLDRWVGRLIDYPKAKMGYEFLKETPGKVQKLIADDRAALDLVMRDLENCRDQFADQLGMPAIVNAVRDADENHSRLLDRMDALNEKLDLARQTLTQVENPTGSYYVEAIEHFKKNLNTINKQTLAERAQRTPDQRDDQFVEALMHYDDQKREAHADAVARQQRISWLDRFLADVAQLQQRFRAAGYDRSNSQFDGGLDLEHTLQLVREGRDTIDNVWMKIRQRQRFVSSTNAATGIDFGSVVRHPMTQVLVHAMAQAATEAMLGHAKKAGKRYSQKRRSRGDDSNESMTFGFPKNFPAPAPRAPRSPSSGNGAGFRTTRRI